MQLPESTKDKFWSLGSNASDWRRGTKTPTAGTGAATAFNGYYFAYLESSDASRSDYS